MDIYFGTVLTVWYFGTVLTVWYFGTVLTVWYFRTVLTVWYFGTVLTVWYFGTVLTVVYKFLENVTLFDYLGQNIQTYHLLSTHHQMDILLYNKTRNKMKNKKYHTVRTVQKQYILTLMENLKR
jgi:hypothetical protein